ncbi:MAG TPA: LpqB family beta-propeller domain-containing protein [Actinomycetales bacterium]|nr:LpqB family beta-propeller domain-containing protein [Actinomycetales bacterium]
MRSVTRSFARAVVAVLALLSLAACAGLPDSGPAGPGRDVAEAPVEPLRVAPAGPLPGSAPEQVVSGFLNAGAGFDDDHAVARSFLTGAARQSWLPGQKVIVFPDDASLRMAVRGDTSPVQVDVRAPVSATIDSEGRFVQAAPGTQAHAVFTLSKISGEWRISVMDEAFGLWLPQYELDRAFSPLRLYFVATGMRALVPDLRWVPGPRPALATALVRQLIAGPPGYLRGAVSSGIPAGTRLAVEAVPTTNGIAQVDLSATALTASPEQRVALWAQLTATLRQLPSVSGVHITVNGAAFPIPGVSGSVARDDQGYRDDVRVTGAPIVLSADRLLRVDVGTGTVDDRESGSSTGLPPAPALRSVSASPQATFLVGVSTDGTRLVRLRSNGSPLVLASGTALVAPTVDARGWTWTADAQVPGRLSVIAPVPGTDPATAPPEVRHTIAVPWLEGRTVRALDVSRDGARIAVVSTGPDGSVRLDVGGIVREATGRPVRMADNLVVGRALRRPSDVAWGDRTSLVVLALDGKGVVSPYELVVGGSSTALAPSPGVTGVAVGDGLRAVYLTTTSGTVLVRSGNGWRKVGEGRAVTIPQ